MLNKELLKNFTVGAGKDAAHSLPYKRRAGTSSAPTVVYKIFVFLSYNILNTFLLAFLCIVIFPQTIKPQEARLNFQHLTIEQGLSQNTVYCITQDYLGFMWFGTNEGLNRYDGHNFTIYKKQDSQLSSNKIYALLEDKDKNLWVATRAGLNKFDRQNNSFINYLHNPNNSNSLSYDNIYSISLDNNGFIWIATYGGGLNKFDPRNETFTAYQHNNSTNTISSNNTTYVYADNDGVIWVGTDKGLNRFDPKTETFTLYQNDFTTASISDSTITSIYSDQNNDLWIGTNNGLNKFNKQTKKFTSYYHQPNMADSISSSVIRQIYQDSKGLLWICTDNGLNNFNFEKGTFTFYLHDPKLFSALSGQRISSIYEDKSGAIWVGTYFGGINKYDRLNSRFVSYLNDLNNSDSLSKNVWAIFQDSKARLWVGTNSGLIELDREGKYYRTFQYNPLDNHTLSNNHVDTIYEDSNGVLWVGSVYGGLNKFDYKKFTRYLPNAQSPNSLSHIAVRWICEDRHKNLWIATLGGGLNKFNLETENFTIYRHKTSDQNSLSNDYIRHVFIDNSENIWLATEDGLNRFDPKTEQFTIYRNYPNKPNTISSNYVHNIYQDSKGVIWVAVESGGLNRFNKETNDFSIFDENYGFPKVALNAILEDASGNLWVSSNLGLIKFNPESKQVKIYDSSDGLQSSEFNVLSCFKNKQGELFFGGINGFNRFFPENIKDNPYIAPVIISKIGLFDKPLKKADLWLTSSGSTKINEPLVLSYNENFLSFEFAALSYQIKERNQYTYKLEGIDPDWVQAKTRYYASYPNLKPGEYVFQVKGSNSDGIWNETAVSLKIVITPPFWQTKLAYLFYLLLTSGTIYSAVRYRLQSLQKTNLLLEKTVAKRTLELANALNEIKDKNQALQEAKTELEKNNSELGNKNQLLDQKNQDLDQKVTQLVESQQQADRIFSALAQALPGTVLDGKYRLDSKIGSGGFGVVYRGTHLAIKQPIAVKIFKPSPGNDSAEALARFKLEAISAARVKHPNVVTVYDSGVSKEGIAYLVMELLEGCSLKTELREKKSLSLVRSLEIILPVCDVLATAHSIGLVHRDIKPDNIFLHKTTEGELVKVLDFGIAKLIEKQDISEISSLTGTGRLIGTPTYMSPERLLGQTCDSSSDIYSLGILMYEMLSGKQPFHTNQQSFFAIIQMRLSKTPRPLTEIVPGLPSKIEDIILSLLAKEPNKRPTAKQLKSIFTDIYNEVFTNLEYSSHEKPKNLEKTSTVNEFPTLTKNPFLIRNESAIKSSDQESFLRKLTSVDDDLIKNFLLVLEKKKTDVNLESEITSTIEANVNSLNEPKPNPLITPSSNARWQEVEKLFQDLLSVPAEQRETLLNNVYMANISLQQEVLSLLNAYEEAEQENFSLSFPKPNPEDEDN